MRHLGNHWTLCAINVSVKKWLYKYYVYSSQNSTTYVDTLVAAIYHGLRVYYQIQEWEGCSAKCSHWNGDGKRVSEGKPMPVLTDLPPVKDKLLKIKNCHTDCSSMKCSCKNTM